MSATVLSFLRRERKSHDWSPQELAEFYRVHGALVRAGVEVEVDRGLTDEGDPWFVFCRAEDGEVMIHFARIGGTYMVVSPAYGGTVRGTNFSALIRDLVERHPMVQPRKDGKSNLVFHPAALLVVLVATAIFKASEARAFSSSSGDEATSEARHATAQTHVAPSDGEATTLGATVTLGLHHVAIILSAINFALAQDITAAAAPDLEAANGQVVVALADSAIKPVPQDDHLFSALPSDSAREAAPAVFDVGILSPDFSADGKASLSLVAALWDLPKAALQIIDGGAADHQIPSSQPSSDTNLVSFTHAQTDSLGLTFGSFSESSDTLPTVYVSAAKITPHVQADSSNLAPVFVADTQVHFSAPVPAQMQYSVDLQPYISAISAVLDPSGSGAVNTGAQTSTTSVSSLITGIVQTSIHYSVDSSGALSLESTGLSVSSLVGIAQPQVSVSVDVTVRESGSDTAATADTAHTAAVAPNASDVQSSQLSYAEPSATTTVSTSTLASSYASTTSGSDSHAASGTSAPAVVSQGTSQNWDASAIPANLQPVLALISEFRQDVPGALMGWNDHSLTVYDGNVVNNAAGPAGVGVTAGVTFDMSDGVSISIIGTSQEIAHLMASHYLTMT